MTALLAVPQAWGFGLGDYVVTESSGETIWWVDSATGNRTVMSNNTGVGSGPALDRVQGLAVGPGGRVYAADDDANAVIEIDPVTGDRTVISQFNVRGSGPFVSPTAITVDGNGMIFVGDSVNLSVMRIDPSTGDRTVIVGNPGGQRVGTGELPFSVTGLTVNRDGLIFAASRNERVLKIDPVARTSTIFSQNGDGKGHNFRQGRSIDILPGGAFILSDNQQPSALMRMDPVTGQRTYIANGLFGGGSGAAVEANGTVIVAERNAAQLTRVLNPLVNPASTNPPTYSDLLVVSKVTGTTIGTGPSFGLPEHIAVFGGSNLGIVQDFPLLPNADAPEGSFAFEDAPGDGRWFDPIMAVGYDYETDDDSKFVSVILPVDLDDDGLFTIIDPINGDVVLAEGVAHVFTTPVESFGVRGIGPAVDGEDPLAFPVFLSFDQMSVSFTMTPVVPEPAALTLVAASGLLIRRRRAA